MENKFRVNFASQQAQGLIGAYQFIDSRRGLVRDVSLYNATGATNGTSTFSIGRYANDIPYMHFVGTNDHVRFFLPIGFDLTDITLSFWFRVANGATLGTIINQRETTEIGKGLNAWYGFAGNPDKMNFGIAYPQAWSGAKTNVSVNDGKLHHFCGTIKCKVSGIVDLSTYITLYVDGREVGKTSTHYGMIYPQTSAKFISIGGYNDGYNQPFTGSAGDVRVYNRALNASEILEIYTNPFDLFETQKTIFLFPSLLSGGSARKTHNGLAAASMKARNGLAVAGVKTINGLS